MMHSTESVTNQALAAAQIAAGSIPVLAMVAGVGVLNMAGATFSVAMAAIALGATGWSSVILMARHRRANLGWASQVTLARLALVAVLAAVVLQPALYNVSGWWLTGLALIALVLDGVDGWLARRLGESSDFGARFDMEVDAALMMILSIGLFLSSDIGPWVLLIGAMRYGFVLAAWIYPWLGAPLPPRFRRKFVCVWQVLALVLAMVPLTGQLVEQMILFTALVGLIYSFAADIRWLWSRRAAPCTEQVML